MGRSCNGSPRILAPSALAVLVLDLSLAGGNLAPSSLATPRRHCAAGAMRRKSFLVVHEIAMMWRFTRNNRITEGFHNKIEVLRRQAYGFRNFNNYRLRIDS